MDPDLRIWIQTDLRGTGTVRESCDFGVPRTIWPPTSESAADLLPLGFRVQSDLSRWLECLAASVSYAISYIYMDKYVARRGLSPITRSACQLLAAAVMPALALAITGARAPHFTAVSVAGVVILGVIGTGFAYVLHYQIITSEGATIASTVTYLLPVIAIVLGVLVLSENITALVIAGIALVLAGVALTRRREPATES